MAIAAVIKLSADKAALSARLDAQKEAQKQLDEQREASIKEQKDQAAKSLEEMRNAFKALSAENSEHFRKASAESVGELLKPIQEKFKEFSESVKSSDEKNAQRSGSMEKMIHLLSEQSKAVGNQAQALADAITGQSKTQGDIGEMLLVDLLRESGLQEGVNFDVQGVIRDELGHEIKSDDGPGTRQSLRKRGTASPKSTSLAYASTLTNSAARTTLPTSPRGARR